MAYDVDRIRAHFPALAKGVAHFDGPGGSQVPDVVADAIRNALVAPMANRGRVTEAERHSDDLVLGCRKALADLLNADPRGIVFGRSMTQLTFDVSRALAKTWPPADEVVVSRLDHDANIRPWTYAAEAAGATVRWADFDPEYRRTDAGRRRRRAHRPHPAGRRHRRLQPDRHSTGPGRHRPTGTRLRRAVLRRRRASRGACPHRHGRPRHRFLRLLALQVPRSALRRGGRSPGGARRPAAGQARAVLDEIPERFEFGTLPYELMAGTTAAVDFLAGMASSADNRRDRLVESMTALEEYEDGLRHRLEDGLRELPGITLLVPGGSPDADPAAHLRATLDHRRVSIPRRA